jgi:arylsulfatase A-like enzyme
MVKWLATVLLAVCAGLSAAVIFALLPGIEATASTVIQADQPRQPDVVLVTIDALRADHLALSGYPQLTSPLIDTVGRHAVVFTNTITQAPYTKAAIASLMSGLSPTAHKTVTASVPFNETMTGSLTTKPLSTDVLPSDIVTLAEGLKAAGYHTVGFTANPFLIAPFGFAQGFDTFEFLPGGEFAAADRLVQDALDAVQQSGPAPVFLWLHLMEPHSPYVPPFWTANMFHVDGIPQPIPQGIPIPPWLIPGSPRDLRAYRTNYDDEIAAADVAVDVLLRGFGELRDADNTVTVITADHGEQFLDHGGFEHNDTLYDELIHVPLIIKAPRVNAAIVDTQVELLDLYPTLLTFGRADVPTDHEGRDLGPLLRPGNQSKTSRPAYSEIYGVMSSVRADGWKLIRRADGFEQLFDLRRDPAERENLATTDRKQAALLEAQLDAHASAANERGHRITSHAVPVDPETVDRLRALGYAGSPKSRR